jgi:hypothetical protein
MCDVVELLEDPNCDVERTVEARAELRRVIDAACTLTEVEHRAVFGSAAGYAAIELGPVKQVDNGAQRGLAKLRRAA